MGKNNQLREDSSIYKLKNVEYITYVFDVVSKLQTLRRWLSEMSYGLLETVRKVNSLTSSDY